MKYEGQQRPEQAVRTREQFAAELAARLRLAAPGKLSESLYDMTAIALNVTSDERSVALGKHVELRDALGRYSPPIIPASVSLGLATAARALSHHLRKAARTRS